MADGDHTPDDRVDLTLVHGPEDTDPRAAGFQAEIDAFAEGLRRQGVRYSQKGMAFDSVEVLGYPLPEFIVAVSPIAVAAIDGIVTLVRTWMETRPGRGFRYRDRDTYVGGDRVDDLRKLKAFLEDTKRLRDDSRKPPSDGI